MGVQVSVSSCLSLSRCSQPSQKQTVPVHKKSNCGKVHNIVVIGENISRERGSSLVCRDLSAAVHKWKNRVFEEDTVLGI